MATDATQIVCGANGSINVAPVGTTAPVNEIASYSGWTDLGFASEDGVKFKDGKETRDRKVWQAFYPAGKKVIGRSFMLNFTLMQWNKSTFPLSFGGGTITTVSAGHYKYTPPAAETIDYRAMGIDWVDTYHYRLIVPRGLVSDDVETDLTRTDDAVLAVAFEATPVDSSTAPWYMLTDDPAFL